MKETCLLLAVCGVLNCTADDDDDNTVLSAERSITSSSAWDCSWSSACRISAAPADLEVVTAFRTVCIDNGLFFGALKVGRLSGSLPVFDASLIGVLLLLLLEVWVSVEASLAESLPRSLPSCRC